MAIEPVTTPVGPAPTAPPSGIWTLPDRGQVLALGVLCGIAFVGAGSYFVKGRAAEIIFDHPSQHFPYPFTIQNFMHLLFFCGLADLYVRWRAAAYEHGFLKRQLLPEDDSTVLRVKDMGPLRRRVLGKFGREYGILPGLINLAILQFQSSKSVDQAASVMSASLEMTQHRVDLRYGMVRFIAWLVPTLGFIGTVYGLGAALMDAGKGTGQVDVRDVARKLGVGFDCTMVALAHSAILVFVLQQVQSKEESAISHSGDYTLRNLINRLYVD